MKKSIVKLLAIMLICVFTFSGCSDNSIPSQGDIKKDLVGISYTRESSSVPVVIKSIEDLTITKTTSDSESLKSKETDEKENTAEFEATISVIAEDEKTYTDDIVIYYNLVGKKWNLVNIELNN